MRTDDLLILLEVARCGSFLRAGSALGIDHSTVSRRIGALERELQGPLVERGAQGCTLTPLGQQLLHSCEQVESAVTVFRQLSGRPEPAPGGLHGLVRIATTEAFGTYIVTPVMAHLHRENPGLHVEIVTQTRLSSYRVGADIEIGVGEPVHSRPNAEKLTDYRLGLYASTAYLRGHGTPESRWCSAHTTQTSATPTGSRSRAVDQPPRSSRGFA
ncbi:LysR family transcriptional regulator [Streptomyces sp. MAR25Y5]|uniref:LysR family transcriptional regulator n=1 Tax=Streptomyces sp. MAR25Y5 TaxID=2962028 RepID=UPI0035A926B9